VISVGKADIEKVEGMENSSLTRMEAWMSLKVA
jgi:hypothetical protein